MAVKAADAESAECHQLEADQRVLYPGGEFDSPRRDPCAQDDQPTRNGGYGKGFRGDGCQAKEREQVRGGDLSHSGARNERGHLRNPAAQEPPGSRPEDAGDPDEDAAAIGHLLIEVPECQRGKQDGNEAQEERCGGARSNSEDHEAERHGQAVGGGYGRQAQGDGGADADRSGFQAFGRWVPWCCGVLRRWVLGVGSCGVGSFTSGVGEGGCDTETPR